MRWASSSPSTTCKPVYIQNQFGAPFGGPVKKDKLFYFLPISKACAASSGLCTFATVPTADQKAGHFGTPIRNPLTGPIYADGNLPASRSDRLRARPCWTRCPLPNLVTTTSNNFQSLPRSTINDNKGDARVDYYLTDRLTTYFRYSHRLDEIFVPGNIPGPAGGNNNGNVRILNQQIESRRHLDAQPDHDVGSAPGRHLDRGRQDAPRPGRAQSAGRQRHYRPAQDPRVKGALNSQSVTGFSQFGRQGSNPQFQNPFVVNPKINFSARSWAATLCKIGYEYQRIDTAIDDFNPVYGSDSYSGQFSQTQRRGHYQSRAIAGLQPGRLHDRRALQLRAQQLM